MTAAGAPPLPGCFEFAAPREWRAIDFVSDLHLAANTPRTAGAFAQWLRTTTADAVVILGDLFEAWIGDDSRVPGSFAAQVSSQLAEASSRMQLAFMAGNRDFLVGHALLDDAGMTALPDPTVLDAWGERVLLTHGDRLCLADTDYQAFRAQVRTPHWRGQFLSKPLAERERLARGMRDASAAAQRAKASADWADVDAAAAVAWMHACGAREMVHGHTHRPGSATLAPGFTRHVLSDWDLDGAHGAPRAQALRLTRDGFERIELAAEKAPR